MSTSVQQDQMASASITGIFGGCSWYITNSDGTYKVSQHPLPHKGKVQQVAETSSGCDICKRILHNPVVYRYCSPGCKLGGAPVAADRDASEADIMETTATVERKKFEESTFTC
ncbi:hypothetical protein POM88_037380 [Heracleum sosnowskyi]|uniref:Uncharacterized protein n=1 Tax=Heracleum sosnowskyi TaxID=360622 RepID=A0AAD8HR01_9APIA|nr:hypothetical protein POM88_037380 [Heracleum sosnowskyi]